MTEAPTACARCGAPIDATRSVSLPDGAICLGCLGQAAEKEAVVQAYRRQGRLAIVTGAVGATALAFGVAVASTSAQVLGAVLGLYAVLRGVQWVVARPRPQQESPPAK